MGKRQAIISTITLLVCLCAPSAMAKTVYVKASATGSNTGTNWTNAYTLLQSGLNSAVSGDEIWVAAGTYLPTQKVGGTTERYRAFQMKNGVRIYGGYTGTGTDANNRNWRTNVTILSGDIGTINDASDNCYHVLYMPAGLGLDSSAVLDGFTITGGQAMGASPHNCGGGMYIGSGRVALTNCAFLRNRASYGGGLYGDADAINCMFEGNVASDSSGFCHGGGAYSGGDFANCVFVGNTGGALFYTSPGSHYYGGGLWNCTVTSNQGTSWIYHSYWINYIAPGEAFLNCLVTDSVSVYLPPLDSPRPEGASAASVAGVAKGELSLSDPNAVLIDPNAKFVRGPNHGPDGVWGTADDDYGDLRLKAGLPYVDTGNNSYVTATTDILGNPRIVNGDSNSVPVVDLGAYERQCVVGPTGDVSDDCGVDFADYAMLVSRWNQGGCGAGNSWCYGADIDQNGIVDMRDMAALAEHWMEGM